MAIADLIALVLVLGGGAMAFRALIAIIKGIDRRNIAHDKLLTDQITDLKSALSSKDYRKLDDFIVVWGASIDTKALEYVKQRRDELYIESSKE